MLCYAYCQCKKLVLMKFRNMAHDHIFLKIHKNKFIVTVERTLPNGSVEHLEMDIYCRHHKLYPNNSFVRDLVSILNDRNIRVINNGRVFEKNKVTDLKDHLRKREESAKTTPQTDNELPEAKTEKPWSAPSSPPPVPHEDPDDTPPTTEFTKMKKRLKKKYGKKPHKKERSREHSLLLPEIRDFVSIAGGKRANGTRMTLRADTESDREPGARPQGRLTWSAEDRDSYSFTARPDSSELRHNEDRARDDYGRGDTWGDNEGHRTPGHGKDTRIVEDTFEERHRDLDKETRAREDAIARHAEVLSEVQGKPHGDRDSRPRHVKDPDRHKADRVHHKSDHDRHTADRDRHPADRDRHPVDKDHHPVDSDRHPVDKDRHPVDRDRNSVEHDRDAAESERDGTELKPWDPWEADHTQIAGSLKDSDARKALPHDPHDEVAKFVFNDVWERPTQADSRVSDLAKQVMMEYDEFTQQPTMTPHQRSGMQESLALREKLVPPQGGEAPGKRGEAGERGEANGKRGEAPERGGNEARERAGTADGGSARERGSALRLRVKSNMTFNLGDELLNWRRTRTKGASQESDSESASNDDVI